MAGAVLVLLSTIGCRQPRPTYEYGETETTITTTPPPGREVTTTTLAPKGSSSGSSWKRGEAR
jgi:hypothetical protein